MSKRTWLCIVGGVLWAASYNLVWGIAWFSFMQQEWSRATAAIDQALPWTPLFWAFWIPTTVLLGIAIMAYLVSRPNRAAITRAATAASFAIWILAAAGMGVWGWHESLAASTVVLDSLVNLFAMAAAGAVGVWVQSAHSKDKAASE